MHSSLLGTVILTFTVAFAFAGVIYSNLSWVMVIIGILCVFVYSRLRFAREIRETDLNIERKVLDDTVMTGQPAGIKVSVLNRGRAGIRGVFEDQIPNDCEISAGRNRVETVLPPRSVLTMTYSITPLKRGTHHIPGLRIHRDDALGLFFKDQMISEGTDVTAHTSKESLQTARKMAGREHLEFSGISRSPAIVLRELEFEGIREYVPGDRARDIHWKIFPRIGKMMTKIYKKEGVLQTTIFIDAGRSMRLESSGVAKIDHALDLAVQLSRVLLSSLHPAGVMAFDEVKVLDRVKPALDRNQFDKITKMLREVPGSFTEREHETPPTEKLIQPETRTEEQTADARGQASRFLATVETLSKAGKGKELGLGLDGAINEVIASSRGREQLFIVITDLISSREAVTSGARICRNTGNRMFVIHTYDDWYRKRSDLPDDEMERLYGNMSQSLKAEGLLRALGAYYIRIGPADTTSGIVRATRRGKI